jgi:thioredoxin 2
MTQPNAGHKATVRCIFCSKLNRVDLSKLDHHPKCGECGRPILLDRPLPVTDQEFDQVVADAEVPVVVDFYADWCGPCKMMAPLFDDFAREQRGRALVAKLDTERSPATPQRYGIRGIPTLIVFKNGREVARQVGAVPNKAKLEELLAKAEAA